MSTIGNKEYSVEFNDSVFESQAWKKSRYEGQGLNGAQINRYTTGDITYGKTPVVRNVSRNIYIGNAVIPLGDAAASGDETLVQFPSSSYITIQKYITINSDDSISENNYDGSNLNSKNGFYRAFYEDFPIGGDFQLRLLDDTVDNFTLDNYKVMFNQGRLHLVSQFYRGNASPPFLVNAFSLQDSWEEITEDPWPGWDNKHLINIDTQAFSFDEAFRIYNNQYNNSFNEGVSGFFFSQADMEGFFDKAQTSMETSTENRFFFTFTTGSEPTETGYPLQSILISQTSSLAPLNLGKFSTAEVTDIKIDFNANYHRLEGNSKNTFQYPYYVGGENFNGSSRAYGFLMSKLNNSTPSILTNLYQPEQLPSYFGNAPFIVIPSNLHPYIKDNLLYFLNQAGVNIGNNTAPGKPDQQNQKLT
jgi:hypothetical protein